jgi:hypothetical protein
MPFADRDMSERLIVVLLSLVRWHGEARER